ncbi:hypothetical protein EST38_g12530 [Candolleomyces aberdarensis]|uniref:Uncharacterized protein n=1 Tax=Candolleomyces aberdarensis TaxID=2316362 RepID=A0A4Q2D4E5_9AGAR|nr:hypothetical protein EST38_g12530 [Candolleomyces aberdarensis]
MDNEAIDIQPYTLAQFCERAHDLYMSNNSEEFVHFVLCGVDEGRQASIDVIRNRVTSAEVPTLRISRDYDSILGIDRQIRVHARPITVTPVAKYEDTLKTNVHLKYSFTNATGDHTAPLHHIPNLGLAKWETHNLIRVLFPDLYGPDRQSFHLSKQEQVEFYEKGLLPTLQLLLEHRGGDLPPTYDAEMFRARQQSGKLSFTTRMLPDWQVEWFGDTLRRVLVTNGVTWGANLVFLHQIRGMKNATHHFVLDKQNGEVALDEFLDRVGLRLDILKESGEWWVDVGAEISSTQNRCLAWRTDKHASLVQLALNIQSRHAERITKLGSSKYYRDPASHLIGASGFRITPGVWAQGEFEAQYIQAYTTDKALTYALDNGKVSKYITPGQLLHGKGESYISGLYDVYRQGVDENFSTARIELRVPIEHAASALIYLDLDALRRCLLSFSSWVWWGTKSWRAHACKFVDDWQRGGPINLRLHDSALHLTAGISWLLNGIHSTPDTGPSSRELMNVILPRAQRNEVERHQLPFPISIHDDEEMEGEDQGAVERPFITRLAADAEDETELESLARGRSLVPCVPYGMYFLRPLRPGVPVPRLSADKVGLSERSFQYLFGKTKTEILTLFLSSKVSIPRDPTRLHNRTRQRLMDPPDAAEGSSFALETKGHDLGPPICDDGSDIAMSDQEEQDDPLGTGLDNQMERCFRQFFRDTVKLVPNRRHAKAASYCAIPKDQLEETTITTFQNINLCDTFNDVQWHVASSEEWRQSFDHLWPPKDVKKEGIVQNYNNAAYYGLWEAMTERMTKETAEAARKSLWRLFNTLEWAPNARCDRIWQTRKDDSRFKNGTGASKRTAAPQVLMRRKRPTWIEAMAVDAPSP